MSKDAHATSKTAGTCFNAGRIVQPGPYFHGLRRAERHLFRCAPRYSSPSVI